MITKKTLLTNKLQNIFFIYIQLSIVALGGNIFTFIFLFKTCLGDQDLQCFIMTKFQYYFELKFGCDPKIHLYNAFSNFLKMFILASSAIALCVELTEFSYNIFKMPIFKPKFSCYEILKANMVKHPERVMTI